MFRLAPKQRDEWFEVGLDLLDPLAATPTPVDLTGATVTMTVRSGPKSTDPLVTVAGEEVVVLAPPSDGKVSAGGRISTPGAYYGTVEVTVPNTPGWPVRETFFVRVVDCP